MVPLVVTEPTQVERDLATLPAFRHRTYRLALPIVAANLTVPLVGIVDTAVVGHLGNAAAIGAVSVGAALFSTIFFSFGFLRMGSTGLIGRALGRDADQEAVCSAYCAWLMALALGLMVWLLQAPLLATGLWLIEPPAAVLELTDDYAGIRIWSAPAILINMVVTGALVAVQRTGGILGIQLLLNGLNVALDLLFVVGLGWGVAGVALASVIAEVTAAAAGTALVLAALPRLKRRPSWAELMEPTRWRALVAVNTNIFIRTVCLLAVYFHLTAVGARFGEVTLAANGILLHFQFLLGHGLDGFAHAVEALAGQAYARGRRVQFWWANRAAIEAAALVSLLYTAVYVLGGHWLIRVMTSVPEVVEAADLYLPWMWLAPLVSVWSFHLDGVFVGTLGTREMRDAMIVSVLIYALAVIPMTVAWGNHGLWAAFMLLMAMRALTLAVSLPRLLRGLPAV